MSVNLHQQKPKSVNVHYIRLLPNMLKLTVMYFN